ncbi:hypothetical protein DINM_021427 [Dirofilaria immitis]|nr:hypothetical protein [Dirofilaria immitis]
MRPPLNRAIPPIPESKSNDSIITHIPEKHTETHAKLEPSTSQVLREPSCVKSIGELVASFTAKISSQKIESEGSLIIENTMAHSLVTKTAVIISNRNGRSEDVPRSPLMSVAHSVRSKLTKFGSRFSRSDENQNIRTSTSLSSMRRGPVDKLSYIPPNTQFKKSASMETRTNQNSTKDSIEFFPSRQILGSNALRIPRIPRSRTSLNDQSLDLKTSKENVLLNHDKYSELIRPKDLPSKSGNEKTNSIVKAFKVHLEPRATQTVSRPDRIRQLNSPIVAFTMTTEVHASKNQENIKEGKGKPTMNVFVETSTERDAYLISDMRSQQREMTRKMTSTKRSFIPLYTTLSRRLSARKSGAEIGQAPLAECESSCIENSPAVEVPPVKFILGRNHYSCTEESIRAQKKVKKGLRDHNHWTLSQPCSNQLLSYKSTHNCGKAIRKGSLDDKRKNDWTTINVRLSDNITNNTLPNNSSTNCSCDNDLKSENSPNDFVSPAIMTSSGFTTSSGFQDSPDKSPDKDGEFNEQFVDKTITQKHSGEKERVAHQQYGEMLLYTSHMHWNSNSDAQLGRLAESWTMMMLAMMTITLSLSSLSRLFYFDICGRAVCMNANSVLCCDGRLPTSEHADQVGEFTTLRHLILNSVTCHCSSFVWNFDIENRRLMSNSCEIYCEALELHFNHQISFFYPQICKNAGSRQTASRYAYPTNRSRSRRRSSRDLDQEQIASPSSVSTHYKNQRYDKALVNENKAVAFPSIAMYESSCNDVDSAEVEGMNKSTPIKVEDSDVIQRLLKENDALRKELVEKDRIISKLKAQMLLH